MYNRLFSTMTDENQIYRFSDYGIQASKDGISFTLKANMGTWKNRVPYIKDNFGIRKITPYECLALQGFPKNFAFLDIPINSAYTIASFATTSVPSAYVFSFAVGSKKIEIFLLSGILY